MSVIVFNTDYNNDAFSTHILPASKVPRILRKYIGTGKAADVHVWGTPDGGDVKASIDAGMAELLKCNLVEEEDRKMARSVYLPAVIFATALCTPPRPRLANVGKTKFLNLLIDSTNPTSLTATFPDDMTCAHGPVTVVIHSVDSNEIFATELDSSSEVPGSLTPFIGTPTVVNIGANADAELDKFVTKIMEGEETLFEDAIKRVAGVPVLRIESHDTAEFLWEEVCQRVEDYAYEKDLM